MAISEVINKKKKLVRDDSFNKVDEGEGIGGMRKRPVMMRRVKNMLESRGLMITRGVDIKMMFESLDTSSGDIYDGRANF